MNKSLLVALVMLLTSHYVFAQRVKVGVSAGIVRSFIYSQNHSTKGRYDYVHAEGQLGYMLNARVERALTSKTSLDIGLRFLSTPTYYDVDLVVTGAFVQITQGWQAKRQNYLLYTGLSHVLVKRRNKKLRVFAGLLAGVETQQLRLDGTSFYFTSTVANNIVVDFDYMAQTRPVWLSGAEAGFGLRLFDGIDLNIRYNYNFTKTPEIKYNSVITYDGAPGSPRQSVGIIRGRPTYALGELVVWFN